ncbi:MAG TPA: UDP-3-O-acyl-N-acetylglucosamine deacetylase [Verrucomicrobiae bacterium]|jgi:UDP-3-O-[3-hydroxymyristoyl] N-acetylglucosamine deacetylase/3-hydroxyacyl-[acyl-carrier-protein] dehydratase|nr:UDP-3-O-acyl-N-acetylglucosamine deacetylase [Verrucomicrobiae bacterium]
METMQKETEGETRTETATAVYQRTLLRPVSFHGKGIHTGQEVEFSVLPAPANSGILFCRKDLNPNLRVKASVENVRSDELRQTALVIGNGVVRTIEHLMATFHGLGIDNAIVEVSGDEIPAMDGSAREFANAFLEIGFEEQSAPRRWVEAKNPVFVDLGDQSIILLPGKGLTLSYTLSYRHEDLQDQFLTLPIVPEVFERELAPARTFCLKQEAQYLLSQGFGKGASVENTLIFERNRPMGNTLRFENEACRHKMMDLLGDLFLACGFVRGHVIATRSGHTLNLKLVRELLMGNQPSRAEWPSVLSVEDIQKVIPHRYPFLFVDKIENFKPGVSATGFKQVSMNDYFFQGHFPGHPVMPGVLIIEAMAQVGGVIMLSKPENNGKIAYFMSIDYAKFRQPVHPGDELRMEVEIGKIRARTGQCTGSAFVGDKLVCEAQVKFAVVDR